MAYSGRISAATTKSPSLQAKSETITTPRTQWTRRHCQSGLASPALLHSSWQRRCSRSIRRTQDGSRRSFRSCRRGRSRQLRAARRRAARRRSLEVQYRPQAQGRVLCVAILPSYSAVARAARAAPANGADFNWVNTASPTTTRPANPPRAHHQDNVSRDKQQCVGHRRHHPLQHNLNLTRVGAKHTASIDDWLFVSHPHQLFIS